MIMLLTTQVIFSGTLRVPQDYPTPQAAVDASVSGDTILIAPGLYIVPTTLQLHARTVLAGSGPAQTVLDFAGANTGILLNVGTATVKGQHLRNASITHIFAYKGSNITVKNVIITQVGAGGTTCCPVGIELNQGVAYTVKNTTIDNLHLIGGIGAGGIDVPFFGLPDIQNNVVTYSDRGMTAGSFTSGTWAFNDVFGSTDTDWAICTATTGCTASSPPPNNISADPLYCPDFTLRPGSPAIDAGNPALLDADGTRSDIGAYGGPEAILPPLIVSPCVIDFGDLPVGTTSSPVTVQLNSTILTDQVITGVSSTNAAFIVTGLPQLPTTVANHETLTFDIEFSPQQTGELAGEIRIATSNPLPTAVAVRGIATSAVVVIRTPPYDFFANCNETSEIEGIGGQASAIAISDSKRGTVDLNVQAAGIVANAYGRAGVGVNHNPVLTGTVTIRAIISIGPGFDLVQATGIPKLGKAGIASIESDTFILAIPPVGSLTTTRFRKAIVTPIGGSLSDSHRYNPPELFAIEQQAIVTEGQMLHICAGIQSKAVSVAFPGVLAFGKALYHANILEIKIIQ